MSEKEYAEDTTFWSRKHAEQFSARRRTVTLYITNSSSTTGLDSYTWIDNTPQVWQDLNDVLESHAPSRIAINTDQNVAFASGMHVGELANLLLHLDKKWTERFVSESMVAVEFVATMPEEQLEWYRRLQETAWAIITEAFSEKVITPGMTHTSVRLICLGTTNSRVWY